MKRMQWVSMIALAVLVLAGCDAGEDVFGDPGAGYVEDVAAVITAADWSQAETVTVTLSEFYFSPASLTFRANVPYRFRIANRGIAAHNFVSQTFFKAIAIQRMKTPQGDIDMPYLKSIAVAPGTEKEVFFVPVKKGEYDLECTAPLHRLFGMVGKIAVV